MLCETPDIDFMSMIINMEVTAKKSYKIIFQFISLVAKRRILVFIAVECLIDFSLILLQRSGRAFPICPKFFQGVATMRHHGINISQHDDSGLKMMVECDDLFVDIKNWKLENDLHHLDYLERHLLTDEVFILLSVRCTLIIAKKR